MPVRDRGRMVAILGPALTGIALIFVILRIIARRPIKTDMMGWDDAIIAFAWVIGMPVAVIDGLFYKYGLGKDIWMVSFGNITSLLRLFYLAEVFYLLSIVATKLALLMFFLRVFPNLKFRMVTKGMMGVCIAFCVGFLFALIFQCRPVSYAWLRWDGEHEGTCINVYAGIFAHAAINMILDLIILAMPMPMLFQLHLTYSWRQKSHIFVMFSFGLVVTVVCILRLNALVPLRNSDNITWDYWGSVVWSVIEQEVGIICACLPAAKVVFARLLPGWLSRTTNASKVSGARPGAQPSMNSKHASKPPERTSVAFRSMQSGDAGFTELVDLEAPASRQYRTGVPKVQRAPTAPSDAGGSDHSVPTSTKHWS